VKKIMVAILVVLVTVLPVLGSSVELYLEMMVEYIMEATLIYARVEVGLYPRVEATKELAELVRSARAVFLQAARVCDTEADAERLFVIGHGAVMLECLSMGVALTDTSWIEAAAHVAEVAPEKVVNGRP